VNAGTVDASMSITKGNPVLLMVKPAQSASSLTVFQQNVEREEELHG